MSAANYGVASLYSAQWSNSPNLSQIAPLMVASADLLLDPNATTNFRDGMISNAVVYSMGNQAAEQVLGAVRTQAIAKLLGQHVMRANPQSIANCGSVSYFVNMLRSLSPEAELVYGTRVMDDLPANSVLSTCVKSAIEFSGIQYTRPDASALARWQF